MALSKLYLKLDEDIKSAMRRKDEFVLKVLRFLKSNIDSVAKDKLKELSEEEVVAVLRKRIKQSEDAKEKYAQGGRADLADSEAREMDLINTYLPTQMSQDELARIATSVASQLGARSMKDFGRVMGRVVGEVAGRADGKSIKAAVEAVLQPPAR